MFASSVCFFLLIGWLLGGEEGIFLLGFFWLLFFCLNMVEKGAGIKVKKRSVRIKVLCILVILVTTFAHVIGRHVRAGM